MTTITIYCAVVGDRESAFFVQIDEKETVGVFKKAVAGALKYMGRVDQLKIFLAKTDKDAWLTQLDVIQGVSGTIPRNQLRFTDVFLKDAGLDSRQLGQVSDQDRVAGKGHIHVLVVIPPVVPPGQPPIVPNEGGFVDCHDPFFSQFPTASHVGEWLEFSSMLPLTRCQKLYIRSSYPVIANQALANPDTSMVKYAIVTGTPGIGKSVFVYYFMWILIRENRRVLLLTGEPPIYFDGHSVRECLQLPYSGNLRFWSPDLWCLVDSVDPTSISGFPIQKCSVLLASTPRRDCVGEFNKQVPTPTKFFMPLWTEEELVTIAPLYSVARDTWKNRFVCLGGVPRLVFQVETAPQELLMAVPIE